MLSFFLILALWTAPLAASENPKQNAPRVDVRGIVRDLRPLDSASPRLGTLRVEGRKEPTTEVDRAVVTVMRTTRLFRLERGRRKPARFTDLKNGQQVEVRFHGAVLESYPVQAGAGEIVILTER